MTSGTNQVTSFSCAASAGLIVDGMTAGYLPPSITKPTASFGRILVCLIIGAVWTALGYFLAWWFVLESAVVAASKIQYSFDYKVPQGDCGLLLY